MAAALAVGFAASPARAEAVPDTAAAHPVEIREAGPPAGAGADSAKAAASSRLRARAALADSALARDRRRAFSAPGWVMLRSAIVPGWGQFHNHAWIKAAAVAGAQTLLAVRLADDFRALDRLDRAAAEARAAVPADPDREETAVLAYNARLDQAVRREWLMAGVMVYSLLDAYVDAHFRNFDIEFQTDPALPAGGGGKPSARLGLRWTY